MTQNPNPLQAWFRRAAIYMRLPSQGQYWPEGSLDMPTNGEFPVLPMTALDEITYRTPDALFNGQAVVDVVQSCLPNIRDAWLMPSTDLISVLISIDEEWIRKTEPSAGDFATNWAAMLPFAPARFSTITGWPRGSAIFCPTSRMSASAGLPEPKVEMKRTGLAGQVCANAVLETAIPAATSRSLRRTSDMAISPRADAMARA